MDQWLLNPAAAFCIIFAVVCLLSFFSSRLSFRGPVRPEGSGKSYACGEEVPEQLGQPDYSQFFPFGFFFTIAHVTALMIATVPMVTPSVLLTAFVYIAAVGISVLVLFRR